MPNTIQPQEHSRGSGTEDILYDSDGDPNLLDVNRNGGGRWLNAYYDNPDNRWDRDDGFAFVVSQLSSFLSLLFVGKVLFYRF
jgi:hypothetical protein